MNWIALPLTITENSHSAAFPASSATVYFILLSPILSSFGRSVLTFKPPIVNVTVKESFVIPGSFAISELSLYEKSQFTVATFVPGSLSW